MPCRGVAWEVCVASVCFTCSEILLATADRCPACGGTEFVGMPDRDAAVARAQQTQARTVARPAAPGSRHRATIRRGEYRDLATPVRGGVGVLAPPAPPLPPLPPPPIAPGAGAPRRLGPLPMPLDTDPVPEPLAAPSPPRRFSVFDLATRISEALDRPVLRVGSGSAGTAHPDADRAAGTGAPGDSSTPTPVAVSSSSQATAGVGAAPADPLPPRASIVDLAREIADVHVATETAPDQHSPSPSAEPDTFVVGRGGVTARPSRRGPARPGTRPTRRLVASAPTGPRRRPASPPAAGGAQRRTSPRTGTGRAAAGDSPHKAPIRVEVLVMSRLGIQLGILAGLVVILGVALLLAGRSPAQPAAPAPIRPAPVARPPAPAPGAQLPVVADTPVATALFHYAAFGPGTSGSFTVTQPFTISWAASCATSQAMPVTIQVLASDSSPVVDLPLRITGAQRTGSTASLPAGTYTVVGETASQCTWSVEGVPAA